MFGSMLLAVMSAAVLTLASAQSFDYQNNYQVNSIDAGTNNTERRCYWDSDCGMNSRCISNKCNCRMGYKLNRMDGCLQLNCASNWDCIQEFGANTRCGIGACECANDYYLDQNTQKCSLFRYTYTTKSNANIIIFIIAAVPIVLLIIYLLFTYYRAAIIVFAIRHRRNLVLKKQQAVEKLANGEELPNETKEDKEEQTKEDSDGDNNNNNRFNPTHKENYLDRPTSPSAPSDNILFQQPMPHYNPHYNPSQFFPSNPVPHGPIYQQFAPHPGHVQLYYPQYNQPQPMIHPGFAQIHPSMYAQNGYSSVPLYPTLPTEVNTETRYVPVETQTRSAPTATAETKYVALAPEETKVETETIVELPKTFEKTIVESSETVEETVVEPTETTEESTQEPKTD